MLNEDLLRLMEENARQLRDGLSAVQVKVGTRPGEEFRAVTLEDVASAVGQLAHIMKILVEDVKNTKIKEAIRS